MGTFDSDISEYWAVTAATGRLGLEAEQFFAIAKLEAVLPKPQEFALDEDKKTEIFVALLGAVNTVCDLFLMNADMLGIPERVDGRTFHDQVRLIAGVLTLNQHVDGRLVMNVRHRLTVPQTRIVEIAMYHAIWDNIPVTRAGSTPISHRRVAGALCDFLDRADREAQRKALTRAAVILARMCLRYPVASLDPDNDPPDTEDGS